MKIVAGPDMGVMYWEFRRIVRSQGAVAADDGDFLCVEMIISELFGQGWSASDAAAYIRATEYVSPDLDENVGVRRMTQIAAKYLR